MENMKSRENLVNAYKGELEGKYLYAFLSEKMAEENNEAMAATFKQLGSEEEGHAKAIANFIDGDLKELDLAEEKIAGIKQSAKEFNKDYINLFIAGEKKAGEVIYPNFAKMAAEEGREDISNLFLALAKVELKHAGILEESLKNF